MADTAPPVSSVVNPAPVAIKNSFSGMVTVFPNVGIHGLVATCFKIRKQLTVRTEMKQQSGWGNELNVFMAKGLNEIDKNCRRIVYNSANTEGAAVLGPAASGPANTVTDGPVGGKGMTQAELEQRAADTTSTLLQEFSDNAPDIDNLLAAPNQNRQITQVLDGTDLNMPQLDGVNCPNDHLRLFIQGLDNFVVQSTRLDSRNDGNYISKYENAMMHGLLSQLWTILKVFGGENNRIDVPAGTLPDDDPNTYLGGATFVGNAPTKITGA